MPSDKSIHHLIWSDSAGQSRHCVSGDVNSKFSRNMTIKELLKQDKLLASAFYAILNGKSARLTKLNPCALNTYIGLKNEAIISRNEKRNFFQFSSRYAIPDYLQIIAKNLNSFYDLITPDYRKFLTTFDDFSRGSEALLFHAANPNYYLWMPKNYQSNRVLICFGNFGNALNIPFPMAHHILRQNKIAIVYIYRHEKPSLEPFFIENFQIEADVRVLNDLLMEYGLTHRFGLGTSLGGYLVCKYAKALNLVKAVNFSGSPGRLSVDAEHLDPPNHWLGEYDPNDVMTVFSKNDAIDQRIYARYKYHGLKTNELWIDDGSHGSFLSAQIQNQMPLIFKWLSN